MPIASQASLFFRMPLKNQELNREQQQKIMKQFYEGFHKDQPIPIKLSNCLKLVKAKSSIKPVECLKYVTEELCPDSFRVLKSAYDSAKDFKDSQCIDSLLEKLWRLGRDYRAEWQKGGEDGEPAGRKIFGEAYTNMDSSQTKLKRTLKAGTSRWRSISRSH